MISTRVALTALAAGTNCWVALYKNAGQFLNGMAATALTGGFCNSHFSGPVRLSQGDTIEVWALHNDAVSRSTLHGRERDLLPGARIQ